MNTFVKAATLAASLILVLAALITVTEAIPCRQISTYDECINNTPTCQWYSASSLCYRYILPKAAKIAKTTKPTSEPTPLLEAPTQMPSRRRTSQPTRLPTISPTTQSPSMNPSNSPSTTKPTTKPTSKPILEPTSKPTLPTFNNKSGAIVTKDCLFQDYSYAIDIYWSCGSERFNNPLRLHTFKRHSYNHKRIFTDQLISYRDGILWYEEYSTNRCIGVTNGELKLSTSVSQCQVFNLVAVSTTQFTIQTSGIGECVTLGSGTNCNDDRSTGGRECGGVDHRYLPLRIGSCSEALVFQFESRAEDCTNGRTEYPDNQCF